MNTTFIMFISLYPVALIMYFMLRSEAKPRKNIILGVTLPFEARLNEDVLAITAAFKKRLAICTLLLCILPLPALFSVRLSYALAILLTWLMFVIVVPNILFVNYHLRLKALKRQNGWFSAVRDVVLVDTKAAAEEKPRIANAAFVAPLLVSLIPVAYTLLRGGTDVDMVWLYVINSAMTLMFYLLYRIIYRQKDEVIDENTALTQALTRVRRYHWGRCWLWLTILTAAFSIGTWVLLDTGAGVMIVACAYSLAVIFITLRTEFIVRAAQHTLAEQSGKNVYVDEDSHWIWGMIYYNPNDKHVMINNRVGMGATANMARMPGKFILGLSALLILSMPLIGGWMIMEEQMPVRLELADGQITASHSARTYLIPVDSIQQLALIEELPSGTRVAGTAMDTVLKGNFRLSGIGSCKLCLNPQEPPYIVITTHADTYVVASGDPAQTRAIFATLKGE